MSMVVAIGIYLSAGLDAHHFRAARRIIHAAVGTSLTGMRMDTWIWAARFFKTRPLAKPACELGRILSNGQPAMAAREVHAGDSAARANDGGDFQVDVLASECGAGPGLGGADAPPRNCGEPGKVREGGRGTKSDAPVRSLAGRARSLVSAA
jgi:ribosomal 50S subunit-recycling heat shock protein